MERPGSPAPEALICSSCRPTAVWVIVFTAAATFVILKVVGLVIPLRMSEKDMEEGDIAVHGHEVYPSDIPSLGYTGGGGGIVGAGGAATAHEPTAG